MATTPSVDSSPEPPAPPPPFKMNGWVFFAVMFAPTLATILLVQTGLKDPPPVVGLFGGCTAGIICGVMLGRRLGRTRERRLLLCFLFAFMMGAVCIVMNCFGCLASGYKLDFR